MATESKPTVDKELKALIPPLSNEERSGLEQSILKYGCLDALKVWSDGNVLLDGHHRLEICDKHGVEYDVDHIEVADRRAAKLWIIDNQFSRRNLAPYTRAELAVEREKVAAGEAEKRKKTGKSADGQAGGRGKKKNPVPKSAQGFEEQPENPRSIEQAAQYAGVGKDTYRKAKQIREWGVDDETEKKLRENQVSIHRVHKDMKEQRERERRQKQRSAAARKVESEERIIVGDFRENESRVPDGSVSLIFTDPPYDRKASKMLPALAEFAEAKLCEGGSLVTYCGQTQLPDAIDALRSNLRYYWIACCLHREGATMMREYGIHAYWKPMLWFVKSTRDDNSVFIDDVMSGGKEKAQHDWQQAESEAAYWIDKLCPPDGMVVDPFLGGGTTAVAAESIGRRWMGFEIDESTAEVAAGRVG